MKKLIFIFVLLIFSLFANPIHIALASHEHGQHSSKHDDHQNHHMLVENEKMEELKKQGFTEKEIFMGAMLGKQTNKTVDEVLTLYKEKQQSWEETAKQLGISLTDLKKIDTIHQWKQLLNENEKEVIKHLATYSNRSETDIQNDLDEKISLRFLIGASAMAKISNKNVNDIIKLRRDGKSFHEIMKNTGVNPIELHRELETFKNDVMEKIEGNQTDSQKP